MGLGLTSYSFLRNGLFDVLTTMPPKSLPMEVIVSGQRVQHQISDSQFNGLTPELTRTLTSLDGYALRRVKSTFLSAYQIGRGCP